MIKYLPLLFFCFFKGNAQSLYTPMRAAVGIEAFGITPKGAAFAEALFGYKPRSFWDVQTGLGLVSGSDFRTYSFSGALTYSYLLNPYRRTQCNPVPGYNSFEGYLEGGIASFFCDTRYNKNSIYVSRKEKEPLFTPLGLVGLRFHFVTEKVIYILKIRYTPSLIESRYASMGGFALGFGWR